MILRCDHVLSRQGNHRWLSDEPGKTKECRVDGCTETRYKVRTSGGQLLTSNAWCKNHICKVGLDFCGSRRKSNSLFCHDHYRCAVPGCHERMTETDKDRLRKHAGSKFPSFYCWKHVCQHEDRLGFRNCIKGSMFDPQIPLCVGHYEQVAECQVPGCPYGRWADSPFCSAHRCLHCANVAETDGYCVQHQPHRRYCKAPACTNQCMRKGNGEIADLCPAHSTCGDADCGVIVPTTSTYCDLHQCRVNGCNLKRHDALRPGNEFCRAHTCVEDGCRHVIVDCKDDRYDRCLDHTCNVDGCYARAVVLEGFCKDHSCAAPKCFNKIAGRQSYCSEHECPEKGCHTPAKKAPGCCVDHACVEKGCAKRRSGEHPDFADFCSDHAIVRAHKAGIELGIERQRMAQSPRTSYISDDSSRSRSRSREREFLAQQRLRRPSPRVARHLDAHVPRYSRLHPHFFQDNIPYRQPYRP